MEQQQQEQQQQQQEQREEQIPTPPVIPESPIATVSSRRLPLLFLDKQDSFRVAHRRSSVQHTKRSSLTGGITSSTTTTTTPTGFSSQRRLRARRSLPARMPPVKKRVQFCDDPQVFENPQLKEGDLYKIWYSTSELAALREETRATLRALKQQRALAEKTNTIASSNNSCDDIVDDNKNNDDDEIPRASTSAVLFDEEEYCLRGLEDSWNGSRKEKLLKTRNLINGILEEQGKQRKMGIHDPRGLQVLSRACSKQARERALLMGSNDARDAALAIRQTFKPRRSVVAISFGEDAKLSDSFSNPFGRSYNLISDEERSGSSARSA